MQELRPEERREFQRLPLQPPIRGTLDEKPVSIHEIGVLGARIQQSAPVTSAHPELRFNYKGGEIAIRCDSVRIDRNFELGLRFVGAFGASAMRLREMLGELVTQAINERTASPDMAIDPPFDGDSTMNRKDSGFISMRLENSHWTKRAVFLPEQPPSGFTVARTVDASDLDRLCRAYESADDEGRRLIRVFAELSVSDVLQIPPAV